VRTCSGREVAIAGRAVLMTRRRTIEYHARASMLRRESRFHLSQLVGCSSHTVQAGSATKRRSVDSIRSKGMTAYRCARSRCRYSRRVRLDEVPLKWPRVRP